MTYLINNQLINFSKGASGARHRAGRPGFFFDPEKKFNFEQGPDLKFLDFQILNPETGKKTGKSGPLPSPQIPANNRIL